MPAKDNLTMTSDITVRAREIDFVTRFGRNWDDLRAVLGIMRPIKKAPGTQLTSYKATIELEDGDVGEGVEIPYSQAKVEPVETAQLTLNKYAKAVSIEAVNTYGATVAIQRTDEAFLNELQETTMSKFYAFLHTDSTDPDAKKRMHYEYGTAESATSDDIQMAIAMAIGLVRDKFKKMHKDVTNIAVFINTLTAYKYLGQAMISNMQATTFGLTYLQNFLGAAPLILTSDIPEGMIIATPVENIILYYVDPGDSDFKALGLNYTVQGETNLIGFHANPNYGTAVGESFALMGMALWAEYVDAIAVCTQKTDDEGDGNP